MAQAADGLGPYDVHLKGEYYGDTFGTLDDIHGDLSQANDHLTRLHDALEQKVDRVFVCLVYAAVVLTIWVVWQMIKDCAHWCKEADKPRQPQVAVMPAPAQYHQGVAVVGNAPAGPAYNN